MTRWIAKHPWWATIALIIAADAAILGSASAADAHGEGHTPVTFCHNGHEITTDDDGLINGHYQHIEQGKDTLGPCPPSITPTPSPTATETPSPTPTTESSLPTPTPTTSAPQPTVSASTGTPSPSTSPTVTPPVSSESPTSVATSLPSSPTSPPNQSTGPGLAETGMNTVQALSLIGSIILIGYVLFMGASRKRRQENDTE